MQFVCPVPAALATIQNPSCPENIGQIQKFLFQRQRANWIFDSGAGKAFLTLASWTPLLTAVDDMKIVVTPFLDSVAIPESTPITVGGGDNSTLNGRVLVTGAKNPTVTGELRSIQNHIIMQFKALELGEDLNFYAINQFDQLVARDNYPGHKGTQIVGIPLYALFVSDSGNEGFAKDDKTKFQFGVDYGWRDNLYIAKPTWSPKSSLIPVTIT